MPRVACFVLILHELASMTGNAKKKSDLQEVSTLNHEALDDSVELRRFVPLWDPILPAGQICS